MTHWLSLLEPLLRPLRWLSLVLSVFFIVRMLLTYRRAHALSRRNCILGIVFPVLILGAYSMFLGSDLPDSVLLGLFTLGLGAGVWQGRNTRIWAASGQSMVQNTVWFLVVWSASFILGQGLIALGSSLRFNLGIGTMCATTGIAIGSQAYLLLRLREFSARTDQEGATIAPLRHVLEPGAAGVSGRFCTQCSEKAHAEDRFCRRCGTAIGSPFEGRSVPT